MNYQSILHIPMSEYAHGIDEETVLIRLRAAKGDLKFCKLFYGDRACRLTPVIFTEIDMKVVASDDRFDYYEVIFNSKYRRLCYYFLLDDGEEEILYYGDFFTKETVDDRSEYYQLPFNHRSDIANTPVWAKDTIMYNIFPDSFATSKRYTSGIGIEKKYGEHTVKSQNGGTISGITQNVDYFKELGITCIYINPMFVAGEYHKYDLIDYYNIDPCFGSNDDFADMVKVLHDNDIKVVIDGVFNHCGWYFFAFDDVVKNQEKSQYLDWFYHLEFPVVRPDNMEDIPTYDCFGYERMMPKINTANKEVIEYFCDVCKHWLEKYNIDGWRLDVASEVNTDFWREFRKSAKSVNSNCILIGEIWESAQYWLDGSQFDSSMNYDFRKHCRRFFAESSIDACEFNSRVTNMRMRYKYNILYAQLNILDSHDASRFLSLCNGDLRKYKLAILFQMCFIGMPCIFYGDEQAITGILEHEYRHPMQWDLESDLFMFFKTAISIRKEQVALRQGNFTTIYAGNDNGLYAFYREYEAEKLMVILNVGESRANIERFNIDCNQIIWQHGLDKNTLSEYGFIIAKDMN